MRKLLVLGLLVLLTGCEANKLDAEFEILGRQEVGKSVIYVLRRNGQQYILTTSPSGTAIIKD